MLVLLCKYCKYSPKVYRIEHAGFRCNVSLHARFAAMSFDRRPKKLYLHAQIPETLHINNTARLLTTSRLVYTNAAVFNAQLISHLGSEGGTTTNC